MATSKNTFNQEDGVSLLKHLELAISSGDLANAKDIQAVKEQIKVVRTLQDAALAKAETTLSGRLEVLNNHAASLKTEHESTKSQLEKQQNTFATKDALFALEDVFDAKLVGVNDTLESLKLDRARLEGKASQTTVVLMGIVTAITFLMALISFVTRFIPVG